MAPLPIPAVHASHGGCWLRDGIGVTRATGKGEAIMAAADTPLLILNAPLVATRLGYPDLSGLDLLELFAFVHPARFMVPTPKGLANALGLPEPESDDAVPALLQAPPDSRLRPQGPVRSPADRMTVWSLASAPGGRRRAYREAGG